jgi:hypothetical protein
LVRLFRRGRVGVERERRARERERRARERAIISVAGNSDPLRP